MTIDGEDEQNPAPISRKSVSWPSSSPSQLLQYVCNVVRAKLAVDFGVSFGYMQHHSTVNKPSIYHEVTLN